MKPQKYLLTTASILVATLLLAGCKNPVYPEIDAPDPDRSGINDIISFNFVFSAETDPDYVEGDASETSYFPADDSIHVYVPWYANIILAPQITVSEGATVSPISGSVRDFSQGTVIYTVRAENGEKRDWKVFVEWRVEPEPLPRDENPRHILEDDNTKYRLIRFSLPHNTYITYTAGTTSGLTTNINGGYISNTANPGTEGAAHTVYFIARNTGELQMALRGRAGNATGTQLNVRAFVNGVQAKDDDGTTDYDHTYTYGKTTDTDTLTLHRIILPEIPDGHVGHQIRLELRCSGARNGTYHYRFYDMWVSGWATRGDGGAIYEGQSTGVNFAYGTPRDGRAAPSIHMNMDAPAGNMEYFYTEVTVPVGYDPLYCYYMTSGNGQGYAGIQTNSDTERRFLFSIWSAAEESDPADIREKYNPKLVRVCNQSEYRPYITYQVFGGEGTGGQSFINAGWITGNTYRVLLRIRPHPDQERFPNSTLYKAWYHNGAEWMFMCEWRRPEIQPGDKGVTESTVQGPYWYTSASHFVEDFAGTMGYAPHMAYYSNHWYITSEGEYVEPTGYIFNGDQAYGRADVEGGLVTEGSFANSVFLRSGGYFTDVRVWPNPFQKTSAAIMPDLDLEALNAMGTDDPDEDDVISAGERYTE